MPPKQTSKPKAEATAATSAALTQDALKQKVEDLFSDEYLLSATENHNTWRSFLVEEEDDNREEEDAGAEKNNKRKNLGAPLDVDCSLLLGYIDIVALCKGATRAEQCDDMYQAVKSSAIVEQVPSSSAGSEQRLIRRKQPLDYSKDPIKRTLVVKPIHTNASEEQIVAFFSSQQFQNAKVERVYREQHQQHQHAGASSATATTTVTTSNVVRLQFATRQDAEKVIAAKPAYPTTSSHLANLFVPRLSVMFKADYDAQVIHGREREHRQATQRSLLAAASSGSAGASVSAAGADKGRKPGKGSSLLSMAKGALTSAAAAGTASGGGFSSSSLTSSQARFTFPRQSVCVVRGVGANTTWSDIKMKLGNLALNKPVLRGKIGLVHVFDPVSNPDASLILSPKEERCAFVFCKNAPMATELVLTYQALVSSKASVATATTTTETEQEKAKRERHLKFVEGLAAGVPSLSVVGEKEEDELVKMYHLWMSQRGSPASATEKRDRE